MPHWAATTLYILRQFFIVACGFFLLFLFFQCSLSLTLERSYLLSISSGNWTYQVDSFYRLHQGKRTQTADPYQIYQQYYQDLQQLEAGSVINVTRFHEDSEQSYSIRVHTPGQYLIDSHQYGIDALESYIAGFANAASLEPAKQVTIKDVVDANVRTPTRSNVSFPQFSYRQAFPERSDEPEYIISSFQEAPMLAKRSSLPADDPSHLPPVAERLPRNPAVTWGPDGVGVYGGDLRQCTASERHLVSKVGTESFTRFDPTGRVQPALAYKWEISDDYRIFTFYLRKGHKWSDGHPFTSHDIAFVCNTAIGSQRWTTPPDWMQATDGSKAFSVLDSDNWEEMRDWLQSDKAFARYLRQHSAALGRELSPEATAVELVEHLNALSLIENLYQPDQWPALDLQQDLLAIRKKGYQNLIHEEAQRYESLMVRNNLHQVYLANPGQLKDNELAQMNCMLLRAALPQYLRPPIKQRVQVEPIPDATGDDSHIIRFTFPRPNPLFLERTATFMFYRGLFSMPIHQQLRYHYIGNVQLDYFDILDWPAFTAFCSSNERNPVIGHIWSQLNTDDQRLISDYQEEEDARIPRGNQQQYAIIDALNRVISDPDFYNNTLFADLDFETILKPISREHCYQWQLPDWNRFEEHARMQDLQQQLNENGIASFTQEDRQFYNTMLFRLSMDDSLVAANREIALNDHATRQPKPSRTWHTFMSRMGQFDPVHNPHPPQLNAWRIITEGIDRTAIAVRNPYYYRVDIAGNQLPYFDRIVVQKESEENVRLLVLKSGNADFQTRDLNANHWSVLKNSEYDGDYRLRRWANDYCGELNFYTLQTNRDPVIGPVIADVRFRQALSLAINREEMIDVFWQGLGTPAQKAVPEGSPYYSAEHLHNFTQYDVDRANELLDKLGLDKRAGDGTRLLPNGEPLTLNVHTTHAYLSKVIQMACNYWRQIGINAQLKQATGASVNRLLSLGRLEIGAVWEGDNYFGPLYPGNYAPSHPAECPHWSAWVKWYHSKGKGGTEPPSAFKQRKALWDKVVFAANRKVAFENWSALQQMTTDELPYLGVTTSPGQVVYVKNGIKNVPELALAGWIAHQPGNCCPEVFYRAEQDD